MQRALSYQLPFERLAKLSRTASRKGYPMVWWLTWLWIVLFLVAIVHRRRCRQYQGSVRSP